MFFYLTSGAIFGLAAGFSPGPLLALVIGETLRHGRAAGIRIALAPLATDLPIVCFVLFGLGRLAENSVLPGILALFGSCLLFAMGVADLRRTGFALAPAAQPDPHPFRRGALANALSPHPYLFWLSVGGPVLFRASQEEGGPAAFVFVGSFYLLLIGSKIFLAFLVGRARTFLSGRLFADVLRGIGVLLCFFALLLFHEGLILLDLLP
ncbi:LysE family translocator [Thiovibrio sp. JS02]